MDPDKSPPKKWRPLTDQEKEERRQLFKQYAEEDAKEDLDEDDKIDWVNLDLNKVIVVTEHCTIDETMRILKEAFPR
jgi:hypothetical protein